MEMFWNMKIKFLLLTHRWKITSFSQHEISDHLNIYMNLSLEETILTLYVTLLSLNFKSYVLFTTVNTQTLKYTNKQFGLKCTTVSEIIPKFSSLEASPTYDWLWDCLGGLEHTVEGRWKGHRALHIAYMWPGKNSQAWLPTQHLFSTLEFPWDRSLWRQGLCSQPGNGREGCGKMALLRFGEVGSMMNPDGRRCNRSLRLSQESAIRWRWRVSICYWTANPAL